MPEVERDPTERLRFPWFAALLCAAGLGMAAWLWMRHSFAWSMTPHEAIDILEAPPGLWPDGAYVRLRGYCGRPEFDRCRGSLVVDVGPPGYSYLFIPLPVQERSPPEAAETEFIDYMGRLTFHTRAWADRPVIRTLASRLTGASVAGLVVAAWSTFVFAWSLRHWLGQRRARQEKTAGV